MGAERLFMYEEFSTEDPHMAAVASSSLGAHNLAEHSSSPLRLVVTHAFEECDRRRSDGLKGAANDPACKLLPSYWDCHSRHGPLLITLERLDGLLHCAELVSDAVRAVIDVSRHKVRASVAIARAIIPKPVGWFFRRLGRWLGTMVGAALSPGCGAIVGGAIGVIAGALLAHYVCGVLL
jgi:hypothetical protein